MDRRGQPACGRGAVRWVMARGKKTGSERTRLSRGETTDYLAARIKRDHPDIAARIQSNAATARERVQAAAIGTKRDDKKPQGRPTKKCSLNTLPQRDRAEAKSVSRMTSSSLGWPAEVSRAARGTPDTNHRVMPHSRSLARLARHRDAPIYIDATHASGAGSDHRVCPPRR